MCYSFSDFLFVPHLVFNFNILFCVFTWHYFWKKYYFYCICVAVVININLWFLLMMVLLFLLFHIVFVGATFFVLFGFLFPVFSVSMSFFFFEIYFLLCLQFITLTRNRDLVSSRCIFSFVFCMIYIIIKNLSGLLFLSLRFSCARFKFFGFHVLFVCIFLYVTWFFEK